MPLVASAAKDISAEPVTLADRDEADGSPWPSHPRKRARFDADPARLSVRGDSSNALTSLNREALRPT